MLGWAFTQNCSQSLRQQSCCHQEGPKCHWDLAHHDRTCCRAQSVGTLRHWKHTSPERHQEMTVFHQRFWGVLKTFMPELHKILCQSWREGSVPQEILDENIVILYKNKGDRSDCNNYHCISLLNAVGKLFAWVALRSFQVFLQRISVRV